MGKAIQGKAVSRRGFLKTTAATIGAAGTVGALGSAGATVTAIAAETADSSTEQVFCQTCRGNCMNGCAIDVFVRDGRVVRTAAHNYPYPEYNRICLKGLSHVDSIYSENRIKYPMRRVEGTARGDGQWERISWEEALDEVITKWKAYREEYGPHSILQFANPGAYSVVNGGISSSTVYRFDYLMAPTIMNSGFDRNLIYVTSHAFGSGNLWNCNQHADMLNSNVIVIWGANLPESQIQSWHFIADAMEQHGAKLIVVNPTFDAAAAHADLWIRPRPGTDGFLANAMSRYLIENGMADLVFLRDKTVAPFLLKADGRYMRVSDFAELAEGEADDYYVIDEDGVAKPLRQAANPQLEGEAEVDGVAASTVWSQLLTRFAPYTLDAAEEICQVPATTIKQFATMYATQGPSWMYQGFGCDRWRNGFATILSICTLAMVAGQSGKPGACCGYAMFPGTEWRNYYAPYMAAAMPTAAALNVNGLQIADIIAKGTFQGEPLTIKSAFFEAANPLNCVGNREHLLEGLLKLDFLLAIEIRMTDTARYCDLILPACHWFEEEDLFGTTAVHPFAQLCEKAIDPLFESRPDWDIFKDIVEGVAFPGAYMDKDADAFVAENVQMAVQQPFAFDGKPITYERLQEEKVCTYLDPYGVYAADGYYVTDTGRAQMYLEHITPYPYFDYTEYGEPDIEAYRWPHFEPPKEAWTETIAGYEKTALSAKYPLVYFQEHQRYRTHSEFSHLPILKEIDPEPLLHINEADAAARGLGNGDVARVFNDRGECVVKVCIDNGQRPGQVNIPKGWHIDQFIRGHWQNLTGNEINPVEFNTGCFDILVEVEPYKEG